MFSSLPVGVYFETMESYQKQNREVSDPLGVVCWWKPHQERAGREEKQIRTFKRQTLFRTQGA